MLVCDLVIQNQAVADTSETEHTVSIFDPTTYQREKGKRQTETYTFSLHAMVNSPFTILVENGSLTGANGVSSAMIILNGTEGIAPSDFNQNVTPD